MTDPRSTSILWRRGALCRRAAEFRGESISGKESLHAGYPHHQTPRSIKKEARTEARASFTAPTADLISSRDRSFAWADDTRPLAMFNTLLCVRLGNLYVDCTEGPTNLAEKPVISELIKDQPATV
jgi:hypothetical protein